MIFVLKNGHLFCNLRYANNLSTHEAQWEDAKLQHLAEKAAWPYKWLTHTLYQAHNRTEVVGRLLVKDVLKPKLTGADAWVGLAPPTNGSDPQSGWQMQGLDYEYWTRADGNGAFSVKGVRPGIYTLYAWNSGVVEELRMGGIAVAGSAVDLGNVIMVVPRMEDNVIVWEIGTPNRDTSEFYHGDTDWWAPMNHLRFPEEFPNPLVYSELQYKCQLFRNFLLKMQRLWRIAPETC